MTAPLPVPAEDAAATTAPAGGTGTDVTAGTAAPASARGGLRPVLRLVPDPAALSARVGRLPFTLLVLGLLGGGLLLLLLVNTELAQGSFRAHDMSAEVAALEQREQELRMEVERLETPDALAERAAALGLQPGGVPGFVRLPDGTVMRGPEGDDVPLVPVAPVPPGSEDAAGGSSTTTATTGEATTGAATTGESSSEDTADEDAASGETVTDEDGDQ